MNAFDANTAMLAGTLRRLAEPRVRIITRSYGRDELFGSPTTTYIVRVDADQKYYVCNEREYYCLLAGESAEDLELQPTEDGDE